MKREAYFLDMGLISILRNVDYLSLVTNKDLYNFIQSMYQDNPFWQDEKLFTLQTFYIWLRQGKKDYKKKLNTKKSLLYKEAHRLKNRLRQKDQTKAFKKRINQINQTYLFRLFYINSKENKKNTHSNR